MNKDNLVILGFCHKPHGIRGAFTFVLENSEDSVLENGSEVYLTPKSSDSSIDKDGEAHIIEKISFGNKVIAQIKGVNDRNVTEAMIPFYISVSRDTFPETDEDEFYISDLIGLTVIDNETNEELGKVSKYFDNNAQIVLTIKMKSGKLVDIPFVDHFVPEVDLDEGYIKVVIPRLV